MLFRPPQISIAGVACFDGDGSRAHYAHSHARRSFLMTFQVGEKIVYPNHGVATIENISSRAFAGHFERFYLLRLTYASMTVMVPFSHVEDLRLRKVTRNVDVSRVVGFLSEGRCQRRQDRKSTRL